MMMMVNNIRRIRRLWQLIAVLAWVASGGVALPAVASIQEIRVVGAGVDNSSIKAEALALDYAKKRAVYLVAKKMGVTHASATLSKFTDSQYGPIIRGANVVQTHREGYTTYAEVNVTIVDEELRRALKLADKAASVVPEKKLRGVLLLSVMAGPERPYMWEKENLLHAPLSDEVRRQSRGGVLLPGGDLEDLRLIDYQNALSVKPEELKPMFARYGAEEIVIAVLTPGAVGTMDASHVLLRRLQADKTSSELLDIPADATDETSAMRLSKAAAAIAGAVTQIASSTAEREQATLAKAKTLHVRFSYSIPKDLARMQAAVRAAPEVLSLDLPMIALARVDGTLYLKGDEASLREGLIKQGMIVTPMKDGWRLSVR